IGHGVDRRRAADHLAARAFEPAAVHGRLRLGEVHPVVLAVVEEVGPADRDRDQRVAVPPAGLEQKDARVSVFGEPRGEHAAGGAGADDDEVVSGGRMRHAASVAGMRWWRSTRTPRVPGERSETRDPRYAALGPGSTLADARSGRDTRHAVWH